MGEVLNVIKSEYLKWIRRQVEQFADNIMEEYLEKWDIQKEQDMGYIKTYQETLI